MLNSGRFIFDDSLGGPQAFLGLPQRQITNSGNLTLTSAHNGTLIINTGVSIYTLPTLANGFAVEIVNKADANMTVTSAAGNDIVAPHDPTATSVAFVTAGQKAGARLLIHSTPAADAWLLRNYSYGNQTMTIT
jgi:hypothetical protein